MKDTIYVVTLSSKYRWDGGVSKDPIGELQAMSESNPEPYLTREQWAEINEAYEACLPTEDSMTPGPAAPCCHQVGWGEV